ncbi:MAG TPA: glycosyltransferase, partial [Pyrinomonadaceae bacterium]|nr:glycosyltransferase [Pyrinomonadaceae bacterium]
MNYTETIAAAELDTTGPRADLIGRLALWCMTGALGCTLLAGLSSALWLLYGADSPRWLLASHRFLLAASLAFWSGAFVVLFIFHRFLVPPRDTEFRPLEGARVHVGLTAYNDEACIADAVRDFKACPEVHKVVVVENNSTDETFRRAVEAGADEVVTESEPGYGSCCMRALAEAARGADVVILCEGDMTFRGKDVKKFLAYLENCDLVLGTRATQELREAR